MGYNSIFAALSAASCDNMGPKSDVIDAGTFSGTKSTAAAVIAEERTTSIVHKDSNIIGRCCT